MKDIKDRLTKELGNLIIKDNEVFVLHEYKDGDISGLNNYGEDYSNEYNKTVNVLVYSKIDPIIERIISTIKEIKDDENHNLDEFNIQNERNGHFFVTQTYEREDENETEFTEHVFHIKIAKIL